MKNISWQSISNQLLATRTLTDNTDTFYFPYDSPIDIMLSRCEHAIKNLDRKHETIYKMDFSNRSIR